MSGRPRARRPAQVQPNPEISEALEAEGLSPAALALALREALGATRTRFPGGAGEPIVEPDHALRMRAAELLARLFGAEVERPVQQHFGLVILPEKGLHPAALHAKMIAKVEAAEQAVPTRSDRNRR